MLAEAVPDLILERSLYVIDRDRVTCGGGTAPMDLMHALLSGRFGTDFARSVSDWFPAYRHKTVRRTATRRADRAGRNDVPARSRCSRTDGIPCCRSPYPGSVGNPGRNLGAATQPVVFAVILVEQSWDIIGGFGSKPPGSYWDTRP